VRVGVVVGVDVGVNVEVGVGVYVGVGVSVAVDVGVGVTVGVEVPVGVEVGRGVYVSVAVGGLIMNRCSWAISSHSSGTNSTGMVRSNSHSALAPNKFPAPRECFSTIKLSVCGTPSFSFV
jgi:hypothetical protein